jgi:hypothetical protein
MTGRREEYVAVTWQKLRFFWYLRECRYLTALALGDNPFTVVFYGLKAFSLQTGAILRNTPRIILVAIT